MGALGVNFKIPNKKSEAEVLRMMPPASEFAGKTQKEIETILESIAFATMWSKEELFDLVMKGRRAGVIGGRSASTTFVEAE